MIAYIRVMAVERKKWLDAETFRSGVALCQMIPGATAMQTAAFVGLQARGLAGAGASFIGFGLPAFFLMIALAVVYTYAHDLAIVVAAFIGLQAIIVAIIANATLSFGRTTLSDWKAVAVAGLAALLFAVNLNPIVVILASGGIGLLFLKGKTVGVGPPISSTSSSGWRMLLGILAVSACGITLLFFFNRTLFDLAVLMLRIDLFAFGGGYASVPLMFHEVVEVNQWMDSQTFMNGIVLGQVTPGPIVITATFIGYLLAGLPGSIIATYSIFLPSFILVVGLTPFFDRLRAVPAFHLFIKGVLCSFVGMLLTVTVRFALAIPWNLYLIILAVVAFIALLRKVDIIWVVSIGAILSILLRLFNVV